jgi:DNA-binding IclR family transcriptional regulator
VNEKTRSAKAPSGEREVQSVKRALEILETVAAAGELGVTDIAQSVGLHVATAHNLLRTLSNHGYLENRDRRYRLGSSVALLAGQGEVAGGLSDFLQPWMARLSRETGEAASASVLNEGLLHIVAFQPGTHALTIHFPQRTWPNPLNLATGQLLVAELPESQWAPFVPGEAPAERAEWTRRLRDMRRLGYCVRWQSDQLAMAFPVRNRFARLPFAVGASAPLSRATPDYCEAMFAAIRQIACELSEQLGCPATLVEAIAATAPPDWQRG